MRVVMSCEGQYLLREAAEERAGRSTTGDPAAAAGG